MLLSFPCLAALNASSTGRFCDIGNEAFRWFLMEAFLVVLIMDFQTFKVLHCTFNTPGLAINVPGQTFNALLTYRSKRLSYFYEMDLNVGI